MGPTRRGQQRHDCAALDVTAADVYTIHSLDKLVPDLLLKRLGPAAIHGIRWFHTRPPIVAIEFEMDLRRVRMELRLSAS